VGVAQPVACRGLAEVVVGVAVGESSHKRWRRNSQFF